MINFKKIWAIVNVIVVALFLTACGESANDGKYHLKLAYSPSLCQIPLHVAIELGFLEEEGIIAEPIQVDAAHVQEAVGAGQVEAGFGLIGKFLQPLENGLPISFTAGIHTGCIKIFSLPTSEIKTVKDLKGKKIGVPGLAGAEALIAKRALFLNGIKVDPKDAEVEFVVYARNDLGQALQSGLIDAISVGDPAAQQMIDEYNATVIVDSAKSPEFADEYCCAAFIAKVLAIKNPEIAAAFTRAMLKASNWVANHLEEAAKLQLEKKYVSGNLEQNVKILKSYNYKPSVKGGFEAIELSAQQLIDIGILKPTTNAKEFAKNSYIFFDNVKDSYTDEESTPPVLKK